MLNINYNAAAKPTRNYLDWYDIDPICHNNYMRRLTLDPDPDPVLVLSSPQ